MKRFSEISNRRQLDESTAIYSELILMNSKISQIANGVPALDQMTPEYKEKLAVAAECLRDVYNGVIKMDSHISQKSSTNVVESIVKAMGNGTNEQLVLEDGSTVEITPELAYAISCTHDQLNEDNQKKLRSLLSISGESFELAVNFCNESVEQ